MAMNIIRHKGRTLSFMTPAGESVPYIGHGLETGCLGGQSPKGGTPARGPHPFPRDRGGTGP